MVISGSYLIIHTDPGAPEQQVTALDAGGAVLFRLQIRVCRSGQPFYLDVTRLRGQTVRFECGGQPFAFDGETDAPPPPAPAAQRLRPRLHFTTPRGWLNDPNGLIFADGQFHLFCQHNPLGTAWGNMHWHHAVTTDFVHFRHLGDALFPDAAGTIFSGSAIRDQENRGGLGKNALLLYYTIADNTGRKPPQFLQGLAVSADGQHFTKYAGNPVVPHLEGENRDPKVVFVPELDAYVMALYLSGDAYGLLRSADLLHWSQFQTLRLPEDGECPDLYYLKDSGKWVFAGAADHYIVGRFEETGFVPEQAPLPFFRPLDGRRSYAAQTFSGLDDRVLRLSWEQIDPTPAQCFSGQLSLPTELSLTPVPDGTLRLRAAVCREIEARLTPLCAGGARQSLPDAFIADLRWDAQDFTLAVDDTALQICTGENRIVFGDCAVPLSLSGRRNLRLIVDRLSIELLADDGRIFSCIAACSPSSTRTLTVSDASVAISVLQYRAAPGE